MAMIVSHYVCSSCGRAEEKPHEICPECGAHNSFEKCLFSDGNYRQSIRAKRSFPSGNVVSVDVKPLSSIRADEFFNSFRPISRIRQCFPYGSFVSS